MKRFATVVFGWLCLASIDAWAGITVSGTGLPDQPVARVALVIGAGDYTNLTRLNNSRNDAQLIAKTLIELGFDTRIALDPTAAELRDAVASHQRSLERTSGAISLFYYAGQGFEVDGVAYLLGTDATLDSRDSIMAHSLNLADAVERAATANASGANFFLIDTSRDNPFAAAEGTRGLERTKAGTSLYANTAILFATEPGQAALDGDGDNSPFAIAVANALLQANLDHNDLFRVIRNAVLEATQGRQLPAWSDTIATSIVLNRSASAPRPDDDAETRAAVALFEAEPGVFRPTYEDGSYALLVGVSDYAEVEGRQAWRDLPSVTDDIEKLRAVLADVHGFEVETVLDPDGDTLETALESFVNRHGAKPNARLLIYMAGHGTTTETFGKKTAWFVPADAPGLNPPAPFRNTALNLRRIEEWSETVDAKHVMWIFDSCFSGAAIKMIETRGQQADDGWSAHLHANPVRRVLTAGSENEEVPAQSIFTARLADVLMGKTGIGEDGMITGRQIGDFLREDVIRYNFKQGLKKVTPQSDTIVIPGEEGDIVFRIEPQLVAKRQGATGVDN